DHCGLSRFQWQLWLGRRVRDTFLGGPEGENRRHSHGANQQSQPRTRPRFRECDHAGAGGIGTCVPREASGDCPSRQNPPTATDRSNAACNLPRAWAREQDVHHIKDAGTATPACGGADVREVMAGRELSAEVTLTPVATTDTRMTPSRLSSKVAPTMMLASG